MQNIRMIAYDRGKWIAVVECKLQHNPAIPEGGNTQRKSGTDVEQSRVVRKCTLYTGVLSRTKLSELCS